MITANDTSKDSVNIAPCTNFDAVHCVFITIASTELQWMVDEADAPKCPSVQKFLQSSILHGWIHKVDLVPFTPSYVNHVNADNHYPLGYDPSQLGNGARRVHLASQFAFTGQRTVGDVMRHEVIHLMYPNEKDEGLIEGIAQVCSPY